MTYDDSLDHNPSQCSLWRGGAGEEMIVEDVLCLPLIDLVGGARSGSMGEPSTERRRRKCWTVAASGEEDGDRLCNCNLELLPLSMQYRVPTSRPKGCANEPHSRCEDCGRLIRLRASTAAAPQGKVLSSSCITLPLEWLTCD